MTQNLNNRFRQKFPADRAQPFIETPEGDVDNCADPDGVVESAVIGLPDAEFGEAFTAVVTRAKGRENFTAKTLIEGLKTRIAGDKVPKRVLFANQLSRNAMGKARKNEPRARYGD